MRDQVASALGLPSTAPVTVDLGSGSILLQAARGRIDDVNVAVDPIVLDGLSGSATLIAHGVPLNQTTPVTSLQVNVSVPTSTVSTAISRVPALKSLKPKVRLSGNHVTVTGTIYIFGFPQGIGATLTPKVTAGAPGFSIDAASFDGATITAAVLDKYLPGLTSVLESGASLCIAKPAPPRRSRSRVSLSRVSRSSQRSPGNGVELSGASLTQKGTCAAN